MAHVDPELVQDDPASQQGWRHDYVLTNGVRLHYVEAGDPDGELVLLLHGFPECWYSWRLQIDPLAERGLRVVAVDLRGFGRSEKPAGVSAYTLTTLAADVVGCVAQLNHGERAAAVIGHDWGGTIAWSVGSLYPHTTRRLAIANCPPGYALRRAWRIPRQLLRSWYIFFFQVPRLPELLLRLGNFRFVDQSLAPARQRNPRGVRPQDIAYVRTEMTRPGALTSGLNYYRALVRLRPADLRRLEQPVSVPTLLIWGDQDPYIDVRLTRDFLRWAPAGRLVHLPEAGHFSHQEEPARVNQLLIEWLAA
ncbi:MAG: alpha/beta fold hydrolase [Chloroflexi bacterium]|nr:alpha/beta fold hydrolase [Chloroflexota bacterium]